MAQNQQAPKSKWGVGSFFQQAVAGVESRLDLMLAEGEEVPPSASSKSTQSGNLVRQGSSSGRSPAGTVSRSSSNARKDDRLQQRLARAMAKQNAAAQSPPSRVASPASSAGPTSEARSSVDIEPSDRRPSEDLEGHVKGPAQPEETTTPSSPRVSQDSGVSSRNSKDLIPSDANDTATRTSVESNGAMAKENENLAKLEPADVKDQPADETAQTTTENSLENQITPSDGDDDDDDDVDATILQLKSDHKAAESRWQEEMHGYIERIDALQSKLKYLAKDAAESAKKAAASAEPGTVERQLLEKDEKVALLLDEGQKLSKSEFDHRTVIKKLRQQLAENSKSQNETARKQEKLERDLASFEARAKRAEAAEKKANESLASQMKVTRDLESVTTDRNILSETVEELKAQLARAAARADAAEAKAQSDALEQEKRRAADLDEELASVKIEREIGEDKLKREISDLKESIEQEKERARMLETELKNEQSVLESKMESLRSRAEEASSGATGDAQAKLLRQIETLQTQYTVASENWQTLEGSLLSRLANVEKERDDVARREGDMRRKIREVSLKAKKTEEELENAKETQHDLESKLEERSQELQKLEQKLKKAADDLASAQKDLVEQKKLSDATWAQKLDEERTKWREQILPAANFLQQHPRNGSPVLSGRRPSNLEPVGSLSDYRPTSRRSSTIPPPLPDVGTPPRQNSYPLAALSPQVSGSMSNGPPLEPPSINLDPDEFSGSGTPITPSIAAAQTQPSRGINDIISESTVGAGPSVQLVERMSATVRRLESERAASKDELARITAQRDEARQQVVDQMREVEEKKTSDTRVKELETRIEELDQRYQVTLEMLGEKSEQVDELQADIADLKKIYRELVDSTMK